MGKNMSKNISKILNSKYSQKRLDHAKQSSADAFKTSHWKNGISKNNKVVRKCTKSSK